MHLAERTQETAPSSLVRETNKDQHPRGFLLAKNRQPQSFIQDLCPYCSRDQQAAPGRWAAVRMSVSQNITALWHRNSHDIFSSLSTFLGSIFKQSSRCSKKVYWVFFFFFSLSWSKKCPISNRQQPAMIKAKLWKKFGAENHKAILYNGEKKIPSHCDEVLMAWLKLCFSLTS